MKSRWIISIVGFIVVATLVCAILIMIALRHPKFTIGPDTTIVSGPLNADGTINYLAVINDRLSAGIRREDNAAILLLPAGTNYRVRDSIAAAANALGISLDIDHSKVLDIPENLLREKLGREPTPDEWKAHEASSDRCTTTPWKSADEPLFAEWLARSEAAMKSLEEGCEKPHCYLPWVSKTSPPTWNDAMPNTTLFRSAEQAFVIRAMHRAGTNDLPGAFADLRRAQTLVRFSCEQRSLINFLIAYAMQMEVMRAYAGLALASTTPDQLAAVRKEVEQSPALPPISSADEIEHLLQLDTVMQCIRGNGAEALAPYGNLFGGTPLNIGDLNSADWDIVLKTINAEFRTSAEYEAKSFEDKLKFHTDRIPALVADGVPGSILFNTSQPSGAAAVEAYLKRRSGESRATYSTRIAKWLVSGDPSSSIQLLKLGQRPIAERAATLIVIALVEHKRTAGTYPETLAPLKLPLPRDPFAGKDYVYRRVGAGFILYGFGINTKDDNGEDDDRAIKSDK